MQEMSVGEKIVFDALTKNHVRFETERSFKGFAAPDGQAYTFDFYIPGLELLLECQGFQHFKPGSRVPSTVKKFKRTVRRDELKRAWCKKHGYRLVCVKSGRQTKAEIEHVLFMLGLDQELTAFGRWALRALRRLFPWAVGIF